MIRKTTPLIAAIALVGSFTLAAAQSSTGTGSMGSGTSPSGSMGRSSTTDMTTGGANSHMNSGTPTAPQGGNQTRTGGPSGGRTDSN